MWKFLVKNQSIEILEREVLADHQIQYVQFKFTFDGDWKRFHKVVQFSQCDEVYSIILGTEGTSCYLPAELHVGAAKMSIFGYDTEADTTVRATTVPVTLNIRASGFEGEEPPVPPTPDLYQQLLKKIEEATKGEDGKSAFEIAVEHGYVGTEEEWLASLHGKDGETPDMSEYPKTSEVTVIIEREIAPVAEESHIHGNKATLDSLTPELLRELDDLQQFEDRTIYEIQTLNEAVDNLRPSTHTHRNLTILDATTASYTTEEKQKLDGITPEDYATQASVDEKIRQVQDELTPIAQASHTHANKDVLDSITEQYMQDETAFRSSTADALHGLSNGLSEVSAQAHAHSNKAVLDSISTIDHSLDQNSYNPVANAPVTIAIGFLVAAKHTHDNKDVLDGITQEMLDDIASISTVVGQAHWHHNLTTLNGITESHVSRWNEAYTSAMNLNERVGVNEGVFERFKTEILYDVQGCRTSISDILTRLSAVEETLAGVEDALAAIVEVTA